MVYQFHVAKLAFLQQFLETKYLIIILRLVPNRDTVD